MAVAWLEEGLKYQLEKNDYCKKVFKMIGVLIVTLVCICFTVVTNCSNASALGTIFGAVLGLLLPCLFHRIQDLMDTTNWEASLRKLKRGGMIKDETPIRISFAYLFRIKVGNKYLLVQNHRGTKKYQPVGGVYKFTDQEKKDLKNGFHVVDDNKVPIDNSSHNDYRLQLESRFLRKFVRRFSKQTEREQIDNLGREFKEELIDRKILNWKKIEYRYCGRHMTDLKFSDHFQMYELLLADIVELNPTEKQESDIRELMENESELYCFATANEINSLGVNTQIGVLQESIGDHTKKILQENESKLSKMNNAGKTYSVTFLIVRDFVN